MVYWLTMQIAMFVVKSVVATRQMLKVKISAPINIT